LGLAELAPPKQNRRAVAGPPVGEFNLPE